MFFYCCELDEIILYQGSLLIEKDSVMINDHRFKAMPALELFGADITMNFDWVFIGFV